MRKFTLLSFTMMASALLGTLQAKDITIYVKADQQPYIYYWNGGLTPPADLPGDQLTMTTTRNPLGGSEAVTFYYMTFNGLAEDAKISCLFNYNGYEDKTCDINGIDGDRYYIYKGHYEYEDITSQFNSDYHDANITEVKLPGNFNGWSGDGYIFSRVGDSKVWTLNADFSVQSENVIFKLKPDGHWLGWVDCFINARDNIQEASSDQNIQLNLSGCKKYTFTATWGGGNIASGGWMLTIDPAISVSDAGYTGYTTNYGVTFPAGVTAYKVSAIDSKVRLEAVTEAPAGTPLIIKAAKNDYYPILKNSAASVGTNRLQTSNGTVEGDGSTIFALGNKEGVGFYLVASGVKVPKGKPYLVIPDGSVKSFLSIDFGEPTGVVEMKEKGVKREEFIFNLAGQRMGNGQLKRGLYIVNGKKVVVK